MDEKRYIYFSKILKYSITNNIILTIFSIIEAIPIYSFFIELPLRFQLYVRGYFPKNPQLLGDCVDGINYVSILKYFRQLIQSEDSLYHFSIIIVEVCLLIFFLFCFLFLFTSKSKGKDIMTNSCRENSCFNHFERIVINFYDHFYFRILSMLVFDVLINYICHLENVATLSFVFILLAVQLTFFISYLKTNRLCIRFGQKTKYPFDNFYMLASDFLNLFLKIFICIQKNILETDSHKPEAGGSGERRDHEGGGGENEGGGGGGGPGNNMGNLTAITFFFDIFTIFSTIALNVMMLRVKYLTPLKTVRAFCYLNYLMFFILHFFIISHIDKTGIIALYFVSTEIFCILLIFFIKNMKERSSTDSKDLLLYDSLSDSYEINTNNQYFEAISFGAKLQIHEKDCHQPRNEYWEGISKKYKEFSKQTHRGEKLFCLFNSISLKVYNIYTIKAKYNFKLLFRVWSLLETFKKSNMVYYINLRFYFDQLCMENTKKTTNYFLFNHASFKIHKHIRKILKKEKAFLEKKDMNTPKDYLSLSQEIDSFYKKAKTNYSAFMKSTYKNEYSKILYRIIIEGILNRPVVDASNSLLIDEDLGNYEEFLDKTFINSKHLSLKLKISNMKTDITEIGNDLNFCLNKSLETLLPKQFDISVKHILTDKLKCINRQENATPNNMINSHQVFKFVVLNNKKNIVSFSYYYNLHSNVQKKISYVDGFYQLGKNPLIITEVKGDKEYLFLISETYKNSLHISQDLIRFLKQNFIQIEIKKFFKNDTDNIIQLSKISKYLSKIKKSLSSILNQHDFQEVSSLFIFDHTKKNDLYQLTLAYDLTHEEKKRYFKAYFCKKSSLSTCSFRSITAGGRGDTNTEKNSKGYGKEQISIGIIDTNSQSSVSSQNKSVFNIHIAGTKEKEKAKMYKTNNFIITFCDIFAIAIAITSLIIQIEMSNVFKILIDIYGKVYITNKYLLLTVIPLFTYMGYPAANGTTLYTYKSYLESHPEFSQLYAFTRFELQAKISSYSTLYGSFKDSLQNSREKKITTFLENPHEILFTRYFLKSFKHSYYSNETFDFGILSIINQMTVLEKSQKFNSLLIHPFNVTENFFPDQILDVTFTGLLDNIQNSVYEIILNFMSYSDELFLLQSYVSNKTMSYFDLQYYIAIGFILFLVFFNLVTAIACACFFKNYTQIMNAKINKAEELLKNEDNYKALNQKISILSDLSSLYEKSPMKLLNDILSLDKQNRKVFAKANQNINRSKGEKEGEKNQKPKLKKFKLNFLISSLRKLIEVIVILTLIFFVLFFFYYKKGHDKIIAITNIVISCTKTEEMIYLNTAFLQMIQFVSLTENTLFNVLPNIIPSSEDLEQNFLVYYLNLLNTQINEEYVLKEIDNGIPKNEQFDNFTCESFYSTVNYTSFNYIFESAPQLEQVLINYCKSVESVKVSNLNSLQEEIVYFLTKLSLQSQIFEDKTVLVNQADNLNYLICEVLFLYSPLRSFFMLYYSYLLTDDILPNHLNKIKYFSVGNIALQIVIFIIIKFGIIEHISKKNYHMNQLNACLKCL